MIELAKIILPIISMALSFWVYTESKNTSKLNNLFNLFARANEITLKDVNLLLSVHGIDNIDSYLKDIKNKDEYDKEIQSIVYLSILLDGLQQEYIGSSYRKSQSDIKKEKKIYNKMQEDIKYTANFFTNIFKVQQNKNRWKICKEIYYGNADQHFTDAIDGLFEYYSKQ